MSNLAELVKFFKKKLEIDLSRTARHGAYEFRPVLPSRGMPIIAAFDIQSGNAVVNIILLLVRKFWTAPINP